MTGLLLSLAFLFWIGSTAGWVIEVFYRRFFSRTSSQRKWINPGFCTGPYLPLYGLGLCCLYLIASIPLLGPEHPILGKILAFAVMAVALTLLEFLAGLISVGIFKVRLWDYSDERWNLFGIICPKFSAFWSLFGILYIVLLHPMVQRAVSWLAHNLAFSFFIGVFFGIFLIDVIHAANVIARLRRFAEENQVIVRFENLKVQIRLAHERAKEKYHFFRPFSTVQPLRDFLAEHSLAFDNKFRFFRRKK